MTKLYIALMNRIERNEDGATAVEYGLMVFLIALAIIITVTALGVRLDAIFGDVLDGLTPGAP